MRCSAWSPAAPPESYSYDAKRNRLVSHLSAAHLTDAGNRLLRDDAFDSAYDENGKTIARTSHIEHDPLYTWRKRLSAETRDEIRSWILRFFHSVMLAVLVLLPVGVAITIYMNRDYLNPAGFRMWREYLFPAPEPETASLADWGTRASLTRIST